MGVENMDDIVAVAAEVGSFRTLLRAVEAAELVELLQNVGPFTVFAPTDEAFAQLPAGSLEALLSDRETLRSILTYHVVPGRLTLETIFRNGGSRPATANGQALTIEVVEGDVRVNEARMIAADVMASNGVVHVIDAVVLPQKAMQARLAD
jgi:uncharacterized surface protein with fasciclin (FAS1) repeats